MFALPKGSGLVGDIDSALLKLQDEGILQMLFHKWWNSEECVGFTDSGYHFHMEINDTLPTEFAFVNVRQRSTPTVNTLLPSEDGGGFHVQEEPPGRNTGQTVTPSSAKPVKETLVEDITKSTHQTPSPVTYTMPSTTPTQYRQGTYSIHTTDSTVHHRHSGNATQTNITPHRRRHKDGRWKNTENRHRRPPEESTSHTYTRHSSVNRDNNPDSIYREEVQRGYVYSSVTESQSNHRKPIPNKTVNISEAPRFIYTFRRPYTYTVPTTLSTTLPSTLKYKKNKDDKFQKDTYKIVNKSDSASHINVSIVLYVVLLFSVVKLLLR